MQLNNISKFISYVLRHNPKSVNISLDAQGWADVDTLISVIATRNPGFTISHLEEIVNKDSKQRYSFNDEKNKIRANQGHSISVDLNLKDLRPPDFLYHGTSVENYQSIMQSGIHKMQRQYVHLSDDEATAKQVGSRHGTPIILKIKSLEMYLAGYRFMQSENKVWLTDFVPSDFIESNKNSNDFKFKPYSSGYLLILLFLGILFGIFVSCTLLV